MLFGKGKRTIRRVLVVEDEVLVAFDNAHFLTHAGYRVVATVDSLEHARPEILNGDLDLVVADVSLAGERNGEPHGIAVARLAHEHGVAVLFVTGACPAEARHLAAGCLSKPYTQRDLLGAMETIDAMLRGAPLPRSKPRALSLFSVPSV
jgi:DNA-binding response OmpR family regulator